VARAIQVEQLVDEQKIGWFNLNLFIWSFLAMFGDGYDITAMAFAAPELVRDWGLESASFGPAFSASLVGILFGAPLLGFIGDRHGRKTAIIIGCVVYGACTLAIMWTTTLNQIIFLRFLTGIGIGGLMPNTISLNSELSPKRLRATLTVLMFTGITLGGSTPSVVAAWLVPRYGWEVLFFIGGAVPLVIAVCLFFLLPESVKYLAQYPDKRGQLLKVARKLRPDLTIEDDAGFVVGHSRQQSRGLGLKQIYGNGLAWITPLLWVCFGTALMANYFLNSWMPLLFENKGLAPDQAALASGLYHVGGTLGGILISVLMDRFGFAVIAAMFALAIPSIALVGLEGLTFQALCLMATLAGVTVLGAQFGNNAASGLLYPTAFRSKGVGWALAIGRFGSILGPLVGGLLIARDMPVDRLFLAATAPMVIGGLAALALARICYRRFHGLQLDDTPAGQPPP
jgi:AAHS family 4-hydroxybenzoate transporter-like MFS transporter